MRHPRIISFVSKFYDTFEFKDLSQVFFGDNGEEETFKVRFLLIGVLPQDPREYCRLFCRSCKKSFSFASLNTESNSNFDHLCPLCENVGVPVWQMTLLVNDEDSIGMDQMFKINYFSHFEELRP